MAKKDKKKAGKKGKDSGNDPKAEKTVIAPETQIENLKLIKSNLEEELTVLKQKYHNVKINGEKFRLSFQRKIEEQEEIILFLEKTIADMRQTQVKLQKDLQTSAALRNDFEKQVRKERLDIENSTMKQIDNLKSDLAKAERKLKDLEAWETNKEQIERELEQTRSSLQKERRDRENREAFLERRFLAERERLKKEMLRKIRETKLRLLSMTEDQLHTTTKRTILENEQMTIELQYQSKETEKLLAQQENNREVKHKLQRQIRVHKETEKMLATRTYFLQKLVDQLHHELKKQETVQLENDDEPMLKIHEWLKTPEFNQEVKRAEERGHAKANHELRLSQERIRHLRSMLAESQQTYERFLSLQDEAVTFVWAALEDVRADIARQIEESEEHAEEDRELREELNAAGFETMPFSEMNRQQREIVLRLLFEKLNSFRSGHEFLLYRTPSEKLDISKPIMEDA